MRSAAIAKVEIKIVTSRLPPTIRSLSERLLDTAGSDAASPAIRMTAYSNRTSGLKANRFSDRGALLRRTRTHSTSLRSSSTSGWGHETARLGLLTEE